MCRIKKLAILLGLCMVLTACGSGEQQKSKVMLYQGDTNKKEEEHYKTTKVKKGTYEEKISATASLVYQNDKAVVLSTGKTTILPIRFSFITTSSRVLFPHPPHSYSAQLPILYWCFGYPHQCST